LTQGNRLIAQRRGLPINQRAQALRVGKAVQDVQARTGVIQAVMNARNGQIEQAFNMIDRSVAAINADRQDALNYYDTLLELNRSDMLDMDSESKEIAQEQRSVAKKDMELAQENAENIKKLMQDPETASFMAEAGVTLNDSPKEVNKKMAAQAKRQEKEQIKNEMALEGYEYVPNAVAGKDAVKIQVGGETLAFKVQPGGALEREMGSAGEVSTGGTGQLSGIAQGVINGSVDVEKLSPTMYGDVMDEVIAAGMVPAQRTDKMVAYQAERAQRNIAFIDDALLEVNGWSTGFGSLLSGIPTTEAKELDQIVKEITSNIAFSEITAMRAASPTGGALGQVSNFELDLLEKTLGSLDTEQKPRTVVENLLKIQKHYNNWIAVQEAEQQGGEYTPSYQEQVWNATEQSGYDYVQMRWDGLTDQQIAEAISA